SSYTTLFRSLLAPDAFAGEEGPDVGLVLVGIGGHRLHRRGELPRDGLAAVVDGGLESHRGGVGAGRRTPHLHDGPGSAVLVLVLEAACSPPERMRQEICEPCAPTVGSQRSSRTSSRPSIASSSASWRAAPS